MKYLFLINPKSGFKINKYVEKKIKENFREKDFSIEYTQYKNHAKKIVLNYISKGYSNIIVAGGDGTVKEVAEILAGKDINLGIIPCGSGNGLARNLYIPVDIDKAIEIIKKGNVRKIDCGLCNGDIFLSTCGTGFDARVAYLFNNTVHQRGLIPYFFYGFISYLKYQPSKTKIIFDNNEFIFYPLVATVTNGRQYGGGAIINPDAIIDDGFIEVVIVEKRNIFKLLKKLPTLFNSRILENDFVKTFKSKNFTIFIENGWVYHLDGEDYIAESGKLEVSVMEKALRVIAL